MRRAEQRRRSWAIGVSLGVHAILLTGLLLQRWSLDAPPEMPAGPPEPIIPVLLVPHAPIGARNGTLTFGELKLHRRELRVGSSLPAAARPLFVAPEEAARAAQAAPSSAASSPAPSAAPSAGGGGLGLPGPVGPDVRMALRKGLGCANPANLSREERQACADQLALGFKAAPVLSQGRDPRIQAYFDAVAKAKAPDKPWTPTRAIGAMGVFEDVPRASNDRAGGIGCTIPFGGAKAKLPPHWLKLGPCFIAPPKGPFTTEVDITPPDQDLSHPPPRSGPQAPPGVRHENAAGTPTSGPTLARDNGKDADGETPPR